VADRASYTEPQAAPVGITLVAVNGQVVVERGEVVQQHAGQLLRRRV
jgi:N-acyl-D-amino-acid deacylase